MGVSIQTLSLVLVCLLVVLVALVVEQLLVKQASPRPVSSPESSGARWELLWFASSAALFGAFLGAIVAAVPFALTGGSLPDAVVDAAGFIGGFVPCAVLGYLFGRWWSFVGSAPMLLLWPIGLAAGSTSEDVLTNTDLFAALPIAAAIAVALSLGSAVRCWRNREKPTRQHHPIPA